MSSERLDKALESVDIGRFDNIIPQRRAEIGKAPAKEPLNLYNTNKVAAILHPENQILTVSEVEELHNARRFRLKCADGAILAPFAAGQYISIEVKIGDVVTRRPYAICSSPADAASGFYDIAVKRVKDGFVSDYILDNWKVGTTVTCSAPEGELYFEPFRDDKSVIGLAGGSGITPFLSMARAIRDGVEDFDLTLLYGCRTEEEILFHKELDELAATVEKFRVIYVLSDEENGKYEHGFLNAELMSRFMTTECSVFVCGPAAMYSFARDEIKKLGHPPRSVRYEAGGTPAPEKGVEGSYTITVDIPGKRMKIPARADETILVALERAGITVPNRCRSGECGWCRTRLKSGDINAPKIAESRRSSDVEYGYIHPCAAYPASDLHIMVDTDLGEVKREVKDMKNKERKMGLIMAIIISLAMGVLVAVLIPVFNPQAAEQQPAVIRFVSNILMSVVTGVIVSFVVPLGKIGRALTQKAGANPPSMKFTLLNSIPMAVGNTLIVSLVCSLVGVLTARAHMTPEALAHVPPFFPMWIVSWAQLLGPTLIVSYILAVLLSPFVSQAIGLGGPPTGGDVPREQ
ncbi:Ferredoxin-NADP reductase [Ruminococcaceae bacterium YRB3002]|nr:Ferredoxin-NADP reductase [Ruminococcaceae bacterium YRB3002]